MRLSPGIELVKHKRLKEPSLLPKPAINNLIIIIFIILFRSHEH